MGQLLPKRGQTPPKRGLTPFAQIVRIVRAKKDVLLRTSFSFVIFFQFSFYLADSLCRPADLIQICLRLCGVFRIRVAFHNSLVICRCIVVVPALLVRLCQIKQSLSAVVAFVHPHDLRQCVHCSLIVLRVQRLAACRKICIARPRIDCGGQFIISCLRIRPERVPADLEQCFRDIRIPIIRGIILILRCQKGFVAVACSLGLLRGILRVLPGSPVIVQRPCLRADLGFQ